MTLTEYPTQATPAVFRRLVVKNMANRAAAFASVRPLANTVERGTLMTRLPAAQTDTLDSAAWSVARIQVVRMHQAMVGLRASLERMKAMDQAVPVADVEELEKDYQDLLADINR